MKKVILVSILMVLVSLVRTYAQSWQWAYTAGTAPHSQAVTIKQDHVGDYYLAFVTDSINISISSQIVKRNSNQEQLWQKSITGDATISDLEITPDNRVVVTGYFLGTITIDGTSLVSYSPVDHSGFIFETNETGIIQWVHALNPVAGDFRPGDLYISNNGSLYVTSYVSGDFGFCAFHKLDALGNIVINEFNNNSDDRSFSHILADGSGNVYLSGTCGNLATFDTIHSNPEFSYQNFLVKYDSSFKAEWLITRNYITFDDNNSLSTDGQHIYWAFNYFTQNIDTIKIVKSDYNGQILSSVSGPFLNAFFPPFTFSSDSSGNSVLVVNAFLKLFVYRYDSSFNIIWQDTISTGSSGFPSRYGLSCYDSSFYLTSSYFADTLWIGSFMLINPNRAADYPSDIFVAKWSTEQPLSNPDRAVKSQSLVVFPNPAHEIINVETDNFHDGDELQIFNAMGQTIYSAPVITKVIKIPASGFRKGVYFIQLINETKVERSNAKFVVF